MNNIKDLKDKFQIEKSAIDYLPLFQKGIAEEELLKILNKLQLKLQIYIQK